MRRTIAILFLVTLCAAPSMMYADDKVDPTGGLRWKPQHPTGKGQDNVKIQDPHAQAPKDGGAVDVDKIAKGDKSKDKESTKKTDQKPAEKKKEAETKPKAGDVDSLADELTPPNIHILTGISPKRKPSTNLLPPHQPHLGDGPFGSTMPIGKYEEIGGRLWRDFVGKKISEEEYKRKMEMLRELERQWKKWDEAYFKAFLKFGLNERNREEMQRYRERIDKRMEEIYQWKPESKPKEKKTAKPIAMETGDATGIFQTVDAIGGAASRGNPIDSRSMHLETQEISQHANHRDIDHHTDHH